MKILRIALIGCVESTMTALKALAELKNDQVRLVGLLTRGKSSFNSDYIDLRPQAKILGIPYRLSEDFMNEEQRAEWLKSLQPDIVFVVGWSQLLTKKILDIPTIGTFGCHPAALPANRGRHPIIWALALGLSETASSFFLMGEGADDGPIASQNIIPIELTDNARTLYSKILKSISIQVIEIVERCLDNSLVMLPQNHSISNSWRKRSESDGQIDWRMSSMSIYNLVRALAEPYPGAHFLYRDQNVKVWECRIEDFQLQNLEPGKVLDSGNETALIKTGDGAVRILRYEPLIILKKGEYL